MSATSVGEIGLDLVVNQKKFHKQMSGVMNLAKKTGVALAAAFGVKKLADFGKQCLELGSDLQEVQNVVDVTFPSMTAQVDKFAKSAAGNFGLSETMAKKFTGTFGAMAKSFGFSERAAYDMGSTLTGLAGDIASFYNISQDEAYTKLKSVFTGETESLKELGVVMTQSALDAYALANGFGKTTQAMSEAEKVALRYQFVQNQLSAASGDFARTSDSWANQVRILKLQIDSLKATIGQGLINLFTPIIKVVNTLIGKLATLANAFKAFTELITGKKSQGSSAGGQIAEMGAAAVSAGSGMEGAAASADDLAGSSKKAGQAARKAAKEMRALMGFDQINRLDDGPEDGNSDFTGGSGAGNTGIGGSTVDFGSLSRGETIIDQVDKRVSSLIQRCKELADIFKRGFQIGFGDSENKIASIQKSLENIRKTLNEIFTNPKLIKAANRCADKIAEALGKIVGATARIGLTAADNLIGGFEKYLKKSKTYIQKRIISLFDVSEEIAELTGDFAVACADIFDIFSGEDAKGITADIIGVFSDGFLGVLDLGGKFNRDFLGLVVTPITQNTDRIKVALESVLSQVRVVFDAVHTSDVQTFEKLNQVYDEHLKPFFDSLAKGISDIVGTITDAYNLYIAPVLDYLAEKFSTVWAEHVQPALNGIADLLGKIFDNLKALWETALVPFVEWIVNTIMPVLRPIIAGIGEIILDLLAVAGDVFKGISDILGGFLDFCTGAFTDDFSLCWDGIEQILEGFQTIAGSVFDFLQKYIFTPFIDFVKGVFATDWSESFGTLGEILNNFLDRVEEIWSKIKDVFNGIIDFVQDVFAGNWESAWESIKNVFGDIFESLISLAKTPLNTVIDIVNSLMSKLNSGLSAIENAFSFNYDFTNPFTGTRHYGHYGLSLPRVPEIPYLAEGGFVKRNSPQLAMIGDNRRYGEIVAPENKLREMAMEAVRAAGGSGITRENLENIINRAVMRIVAALSDMGFYLDSAQIARANKAAQEIMDIRYNTVGID
jgi:phage-related protein|nr:MAG TPA: minor tail protein [Caudoviricetes sp.]